MANRDLEVGMIVRLLPITTMDTREPWNPLGVNGVVVSVSPESYGGVYVEWPTYTGPIYYNVNDSDLEVVIPFEFKSREDAREAAKRIPSFVVKDMGSEAELRWALTTKEI